MASAARSGMVRVPRRLLRSVTVKLGSAELTLTPVSFNCAQEYSVARLAELTGDLEADPIVGPGDERNSLR
jgi:hypothetical protein